jgi:hypothetical protein
MLSTEPSLIHLSHHNRMASRDLDLTVEIMQKLSTSLRTSLPLKISTKISGMMYYRDVIRVPKLGKLTMPISPLLS